MSNTENNNENDTPIYNSLMNGETPDKIPFWQRAAKAVYGAIIAGAIAFISGILPFVTDGEPITTVGWLTASLATLVSLAATGGVVYQVSNRE